MLLWLHLPVCLPMCADVYICMLPGGWVCPCIYVLDCPCHMYTEPSMYVIMFVCLRLACDCHMPAWTNRVFTQNISCRQTVSSCVTAYSVPTLLRPTLPQCVIYCHEAYHVMPCHVCRAMHHTMPLYLCLPTCLPPCQTTCLSSCLS